MALITSCQASFQSFEDYEQAVEDVENLKVNVQECYSEITKTSEQISSAVREEYATRSDLEMIQQDFETSITQTSTEVRMEFTNVTNEIIENVSANQTLLEEYTVTAKGTNASTGGGGSHTNLQPYITCYMWKRTA